MGSDVDATHEKKRQRNFYPRSPRGERPVRGWRRAKLLLFLSTLPAWGATGLASASNDGYSISIHAPRVGSDWTQGCTRLSMWGISIHAPRVGSDGVPDGAIQGTVISIHAPRVGSDTRYRTQIESLFNFYPRSPRGERHPGGAGCGAAFQFLSTLPAWGATKMQNIFDCHLGFLSTLPAWGATRKEPIYGTRKSDFYPRSPRGERHTFARGSSTAEIFLSTLPAWGATLIPATNAITAYKFLSTLPAWGATAFWTRRKRSQR